MVSSLDRLTLKDLHVFEILVETRSTIEAAKRLGTTQSAISQALARLESIFDVALMDRATRPMVITSAGEMLRHGGGELMTLAQRVHGAIRENAASSSFIMRMAMVDSFATTIGPYLVKSLQNDAEKLLILSGISSSVSGDILQGNVDFSVNCEPLFQYSYLTHRRLLREPLIAVVPNAMKSRFENISLQRMLNKLPLVRYSIRSSFGRHIDYFLRLRGLVSMSSMEFDLSESVLRMVHAGVGWTITTPLCLLQAHPQGLDIAVLPLPGEGFDRNLYFVYRQGMPKIAERLYSLCLKHTHYFMSHELSNTAPWTKGLLRFGDED